MDFTLLLISIFIPLVPLIAGIKNYKTLLWKYVLAGFISDLLINIFRRVLNLPYLYVGNILLLVEFILLSLLYQKFVFKQNKFVKLVQISLIFFYIIKSLPTFFNKFNSNIGGIFYVCYLIYALLGFYNILRSRIILYIDKSMFFWINCGLMLYASGSTFLFLFSNYLSSQNSTLHHVLWNRFFIGVNVVTNLIWAKALRQQVDLQDE